MRFFTLPAFAGICLAVSGCSIHPLPEDFARLPTAAIVQKVQCEARDAVIASDPDEQFGLVAVAMTFYFVLKEENEAGMTGTLLFPVYAGTASIKPSAGKTLNRESERNITISQTFAELRKLPFCDDIENRRSFLYPIRGTIGAAEVFRTFVHLAGNRDVANLHKFLSVYNDEIRFVTTIGAGVDASIRLSPLPRSFDLGVTAGASRSDRHEVMFTLTPPAAPAADWTKKVQPVQLVFGQLRGTEDHPHLHIVSGEEAKQVQEKVSTYLEKRRSKDEPVVARDIGDIVIDGMPQTTQNIDTVNKLQGKISEIEADLRQAPDKRDDEILKAVKGVRIPTAKPRRVVGPPVDTTAETKRRAVEQSQQYQSLQIERELRDLVIQGRP